MAAARDADSFLNLHSADIVSLTARYRVPAVYPFRFFPETGGLLSYGNDVIDFHGYAPRRPSSQRRSPRPPEWPLSSWSSLSQIGYFETGDFRQLNVHQNQVGAALAGEIERPDAVARADGMAAARRVTFFGPVHSEHQDELGVRVASCFPYQRPACLSGRKMSIDPVVFWVSRDIFGA